jgi:flagellar hook-length control protein FliK
LPARQVAAEGDKAGGTVSSRLAGDSGSSQTADKTVIGAGEHGDESKQVKAAGGTISSQLAGDNHGGQTTDNSVTTVSGYGAESKQAEVKTTLPLAGESNVQRAEERQEQSIPGLERHVPSKAERAGAEKATTFAGTVRNAQQGTWEASSQGHQSLAAGGDNAQARPAMPAGEHAMGPSQLGDSSMAQSGQAASEAGRSAPVSRLVVDQMPTTGGFGDIAAKSTAQSVGEQIRDSMHASLTGGDREVVVRLRPPELGDVLVRFQQENNQIHGVLEVSRSDTRHQVEQALPQVLRDLHDLGVQVRKLDVTVSDQSGNDAGRQQMQQEAWSRQQGYDRYAGGAQPALNSDRLPEGAESQDGMDYPTNATAAVVPAGRVNMLA